MDATYGSCDASGRKKFVDFVWILGCGADDEDGRSAFTLPENATELRSDDLCRYQYGVAQLFLPAAPEGGVKLDKGEAFVELSLGEVQLRGEVVRFAGEHLQVACSAVVI